MSNDPGDSLSDLAPLRAIEGYASGDTSQDAALRADLSRATRLITEETNRLLLPSTGVKLFAVPYSSMVRIPDATVVTTVTLWGTELEVDVDYRRVYGSDGQTVWALIRLDALGRDCNWTPTPDNGRAPFAAISITADWGYSVMPADLVDLNQALAAILFKDRNRLYSENEGAIGGLGTAHAVLHLIPEKLRTVLSIYWRPSITPIGGM